MFSGWAGNFFGLTMRSAKGGASDTMVTLPSVTDETSLATVEHPSGSSIVQRPLAHAFAAGTDDTSLDVVVHRYLLAAPVLILHSFGYKERYLERRTIIIEATEVTKWRAKVRVHWADHYFQPPFLMFPIRPPPFLGKNEVSVIVQLGPHDDLIGQALILTQIISDEGTKEEPIVTSAPYYVNKSGVYERIGLHPGLHSTAILQQGHLTWLTGFSRSLRDGDYLRVLID